MNDTRRAVLELITNHQKATVGFLADSLKISAIAVRHHLNTLQAEGLITVTLQRGPVGRPKHVYSVMTPSAKGECPFCLSDGKCGFHPDVIDGVVLERHQCTQQGNDACTFRVQQVYLQNTAGG
jgi:Winged helix-turn-helix DNA-binding